MPPRKIAKKAEQSEVDLESLFAAQDSFGSDDSSMVALVAKQMQAAAEKKRKERNDRLLQAFKTEANKLITARAEEVQKSLMTLNEELSVIATTEADNEDRIRALWTEISQLRTAHSGAMNDYKERVQKHEEQRMTDGATALARIKAAYKDAGKVTDELVASSIF
ncbi:hypothetical protein K488DRAFT_67909 [Vararia minispora EC-137]|uniref:Uncharacterized protein n=1 Tax=Vararia minispora EC-137 TaxID=1314806 RepID=A0ACB8QWT4_9AGAM|nr:hypothetical protein K488DRAFT_67909 [Vararia minispora EC-137]